MVTPTHDTFITMLSEEGWTDVGIAENVCGGKPGQPTCHTNEAAKEGRIDYIFSKQWLLPAIVACEVDQCSNYPTQRPLIIEINVEKIAKVTRELRKMTDYAKMLE